MNTRAPEKKFGFDCGSSWHPAMTMAPSILPAVVALLVALCYPIAANPPDAGPWPTCDLLYNWHWCKGHPEGGIHCTTTVKRGSTEPIAVLWTHPDQKYKQSLIPGQDDFGIIYNAMNYEGKVKVSVRFCSKADPALSEPIEWRHKGPPPCKENWYKCDVMEDTLSCQMRLCPWSDAPLLPLVGKADDWYGCTKHGNQVDCYLSSLGERKEHPHTWPHVLLPDFHGPEPEPIYELPGPMPGPILVFPGPVPEPIHELFPPPPPAPAWKR